MYLLTAEQYDIVYRMPYSYPRKSKYKFRVGRGISGLGVFVLEPIKKKSFIIEYFGPMLNEDQSDDKGGKYLFEIKKNHIIDGSSRKNIARYINHSCDPNCEVEIEGKRLFIYSCENIKAGEELTYDYGDEYFEDYIKPYGCRCASCVTKRKNKKKRRKKNKK
jgi:uncharacterized protein